MGVELLHVNRRTNRCTEAVAMFRSLAKAPKTSKVEVYKEIITLYSRTNKILNTRCEQNV